MFKSNWFLCETECRDKSILRVFGVVNENTNKLEKKFHCFSIENSNAEQWKTLYSSLAKQEKDMRIESRQIA